VQAKKDIRGAARQPMQVMDVPPVGPSCMQRCVSTTRHNARGQQKWSIFARVVSRDVPREAEDIARACAKKISSEPLFNPLNVASHIRRFAWHPIDHGRSEHEFGLVEADAPGPHAEALASSIIGSWADADATSFGLDLGG
jgi:hypothetical protein